MPKLCETRISSKSKYLWIKIYVKLTLNVFFRNGCVWKKAFFSSILLVVFNAKKIIVPLIPLKFEIILKKTLLKKTTTIWRKKLLPLNVSRLFTVWKSGNFTHSAVIFLSLRIYVKSILENLEVAKLPFLIFKEHWIL